MKFILFLYSINEVTVYILQVFVLIDTVLIIFFFNVVFFVSKSNVLFTDNKFFFVNI